MSNTFNLCTYFPEKIKNLKKSTSKENQENHIKKIWLVFVWRVETAPAELYQKIISNHIKPASKKIKKNGVLVKTQARRFIHHLNLFLLLLLFFIQSQICADIRSNTVLVIRFVKAHPYRVFPLIRLDKDANTRPSHYCFFGRE